ncbi:MAG: prostaglandin-endoperoxide synthase 2 [Methylobacteriaceae bacterium]|nr:prostaglandin-endoperoxide synthase 2 [Methylobacteriaceae bacterium]
MPNKRRFLNNERRRKIVNFLRAHPSIGKFVEKRPRVHAWANRHLISGAVDSAIARPQAYTLWTATPIHPNLKAPTPTTFLAVSEHHAILTQPYGQTAAASPPDPPVSYITWAGLIDRRYTGRHLPPAPKSYSDRLPPLNQVLALYTRKQINGKEQPIDSANCSALLCFFAQWFTDSFLRKDQKDQRLNTSNHEIDLCEIYGLDAETARALRTLHGGKLKTDSDGRFPQRLYDENGHVKSEFKDLIYVRPYLGTHSLEDITLGSLNVPDAEREIRKRGLYATGLERGNSTILYTAISTIFIREHNRLCDVLAAAHPDWDDDRLFETARNINIVMLLKLTINEYINQLAQPPIKLQLDRPFAEKEHWYRANRIAIEFNLLYRWHSFVPDTIQVDGQLLDHTQFRFNNAVLEQYGAAAVIAAAARQPGGQVGMHNNPPFLWQAEYAAHAFSRSQRVRPFVEYQAAFDWTPAKDFKDLTGDDDLARELYDLYNGEIKDVEFLVGLFAQQRTPPGVLPPVLNTMVAVDAFSQILTNPLLSQNVYGPDAFGKEGMEIIEETTSFDQLMMRNLLGEVAPPNLASFAYPPTPRPPTR